MIASPFTRRSAIDRGFPGTMALVSRLSTACPAHPSADARQWSAAPREAKAMLRQ
jgi:hypothetical protein